MEPVLKWAGGKRQLLKDIKEVISIKDLEGHTLFEPFVGGGALFLDLCHKDVVINDINKELINVYIQIKEKPLELIGILKTHKNNHNKEYYYLIRNLDRKDDFNCMSNLEKAARTIYLNRVCYNGLYRVNSKGQFNVPIGKYKNPEIVFEEKILELSKYLNDNNVKITCVDFALAVADAKKGDLIYFDPPYDYENSGFTSYTCDGFSREDLKRLENVCEQLLKKGCRIIVSNNDTKYVNNIFANKKYTIKHITAKRMINCDGKKRSNVKEVIIYG